MSRLPCHSRRLPIVQSPAKLKVQVSLSSFSDAAEYFSDCCKSFRSVLPACRRTRQIPPTISPTIITSNIVHSIRTNCFRDIFRFLPFSAFIAPLYIQPESSVFMISPDTMLLHSVSYQFALVSIQHIQEHVCYPAMQSMILLIVLLLDEFQLFRPKLQLARPALLCYPYLIKQGLYNRCEHSLLWRVRCPQDLIDSNGTSSCN